MAHVTHEKIQAFRAYASQLCGQVVEQLCLEYEREVSVMWNDLVLYRNELGRVADLLGSQLGRERQLHAMLDTMAGHHHNVMQSTALAAQNSPNSKALHDLVDQILGQHQAVSTSALQGVSQLHAVAGDTIQTTREMQEPLISAEQEYKRICDLLSQPLIPGVGPREIRIDAKAMSISTVPVAGRRSVVASVLSPAGAGGCTDENAWGYQMGGGASSYSAPPGGYRAGQTLGNSLSRPALIPGMQEPGAVGMCQQMMMSPAPRQQVIPVGPVIVHPCSGMACGGGPVYAGY